MGRSFFTLTCALVALLLLLAGCGSSADGTTADGVLGTHSTDITASTGGFAMSTHGHTVEFPAGVLSKDTSVVLTVLEAAPAQPVHPDFASPGPYLVIDLAGATLSGVIRITQPHDPTDPASAYLQWLVDDQLFLPLDTQYDPGDGTLTAVLEPNPNLLATAKRVPGLERAVAAQRISTTRIVVGAGDSTDFDARPPHVDWPSYNAYVLQDDTFVRFVEQGVLVGEIPNLGDKPLVIVHGLGGSISGGGYDEPAEYLAETSGYTAVLGIEYDTQTSIATTGTFLNQAYQLFDSLVPGLEWHHVAGSMGCVVSRYGFEQVAPLPYAGNDVVFACGPHHGSPAINVLQGDLSRFQQFIRFVVLNGVMDFQNADGTPCQVDVLADGFGDMASCSAFLANLNVGAPLNHPKEDYRTIAGTRRGLEYEFVDLVLDVLLDDGLVDTTSANAVDIGALESGEVADNHTGILRDEAHGLPMIDLFLNR